MGLEELASEIRSKTLEEAGKISREAEEEENRLLAAAQNERKAILEKAQKEAEAQASSETNEKLSSARLAASRAIASEEDALVSRGVGEVRKLFLALPEKKSYTSILNKLVAEGVEEVGEDATVLLNGDDKKRAKKIKAKFGDADISGGAIIESADGRVRVDSSLEAIFSDMAPRVRTLLQTELKGEQ